MIVVEGEGVDDGTAEEKKMEAATLHFWCSDETYAGYEGLI